MPPDDRCPPDSRLCGHGGVLRAHRANRKRTGAIRFPRDSNITFSRRGKKDFFVGKSRFFVDNSVENLWITPGGPVNTRLLLSSAEQVFPDVYDIPGAHGDEQVPGFAVFF